MLECVALGIGKREVLEVGVGPPMGGGGFEPAGLVLGDEKFKAYFAMGGEMIEC